MKNPTLLFVSIVLILIAGNIFFAAQYFALQGELRQAQASLTAQMVNERTLAFTQLFIETVLQSDQEVDFETRLLLETSVRAIGDQDILAQWNRFTASATEEEAQQEVKTLLEVLIDKIEM